MKLFQSTTLKLALLYLTLFIGSVIVLLSFMYWATAGYMEREAKATIEAEIQGLSERYSQMGLAGLTVAIGERMARNPTSASIYLIADVKGKRLIGNLDRWPEVQPDPNGWIELRLSSDLVLDDKPHAALAQSFTLTSGVKLLVGRDMQSLRNIQILIFDAMVYGIALTTMLGLAGGLLIGRRFLSRIERINIASKQIMEGDLARRMPTRGSGDELDSLALTLNEMLDRINELMSGVKQVSDNIAHDMRTPLSRLRQTLERNLDPSLSQDKHLQLTEQAVEETDQILSTFNALLRIGNIESRRQRQAFEVFELRPLIADVAELYEPIAEDREQHIECSLMDVGKIEGDRNMLFQALANLLDNALKYSPDQTRVQLTLAREGNDIRLHVRDDGPGIPAELHDKVFQRFYRLEESRTTAGNGLGLSLVAAVCNLHQIGIKVENARPGTDIILTIPQSEQRQLPKLN